MSSRKYHHKSRHGCLGCKQRRKRCDQRRPSCTGCARRRISCIYDQDLDFVTSTNPFTRSIIRPLASEWDTIEPSVRAILSLHIPHVEFSDIELIYCFRNSNSTSLDSMPGIFGTRRIDLVRTIPDYPYLLYGLITASAIHFKSTTRPENEAIRLSLEQKAMGFYQLSLSAYRSRLEYIDELTCSSIFSFSVTLAGLTFGLMQPEQANYHQKAGAHLDEVIGVFNLLLGAVAVSNQSSCLRSVADNPLMLPMRSLPPHQLYSLKGEIFEVLKKLASRIHASYTIDCSRNKQNMLVDLSVIYESAIPELCNMFYCLQKPGSDSLLSVFSWAAFVGRAFVSLLKQRQPAALVVLAYYGVALQALNDIWWLRGVGARVIRSVGEILTGHPNKEWWGLLQWPMEKIGRPFSRSGELQTINVYPSINLETESYRSLDTESFELSLLITQTIGITERAHTS